MIGMSNRAFPPVEARLKAFIKGRLGSDPAHALLTKLKGDASARQYFRLLEDGKTSVLAAYPEPFLPESFPYLQAYQLFQRVQIPVPRILEMAGDLGIVQQEDLGDSTLMEYLLEGHSGERREWFRQAIDFIVRLQLARPSQLDPQAFYYRQAFDSAKLNWELSYYFRYFLSEYCGLKFECEEALFREFDQIAQEMAGYSRVLCHRDYHYRNLMPREGTLYVIDFQDARWGPSTYDLASLLQDSVSLEPEEREELVNYFLSNRPEVRNEGFERQMRVVTVQRLLKALGTFGYQIRIRGYPQYQRFIPGSLSRVRKVLAELPGLESLKSAVERSARATGLST